ncbi:MAG: tetratricopeptide repeat protein [Muribaculaceae bacterium]|nr:tetratricopeptide repeat protein [Muribaculaceae bacterium]
MKNNGFRNIIWVLAALILVPTVVVGRDNKTITDADHRKSSYIFLEAQKEKSREKSDAYFDLLRRAYELDSTNTIAAFYLGHCMFNMRGSDMPHYERALALIKKHFDAHPEDLYETTYYSDACMMLGKNEQALEALEGLCRTNPNKLELQARLAQAYTRSGRYQESNATLDTIKLHHGNSFQLTSSKINNFIALNDTVGAIAEMNELLATAPRNASYNMGMAGVMQQFGMSDSALFYLNVAQEAEPQNGYTYLAKAEYYQETGDTTAYEQQIYNALISENLDVESKLGVLVTYLRKQMGNGDTTRRPQELFEVLLSQHPHEADIHTLYSDYLIARDDYKGAAEQQGYALDINPTDAAGWRKLMIIDIMAENYPAAISAAERALEYNPDSLDLYQYIAPAYFQMKQYDKALATYQKAITLVDSTDMETRSDLIGGMGDVYFEMGDTVKSFQHYEQALELFPLNLGIMNNYAYFLSLAEQNLDKAEKMSAMTVKAYPDNATYLDTYAWVLYKKGEMEKALEYIKRAIDNDDSPSSDLLEHYGDILESSGEHEQAVEQWKKALLLAPDNESLKKKTKE